VDYPLLADPETKAAEAYGVRIPILGLAKRWTFYIGKDGKILGIDKAVQPKTSAEDMVTKLGEYGVEKTK
jgi:peroxiredoxin Q/BCP